MSQATFDAVHEAIVAHILDEHEDIDDLEASPSPVIGDWQLVVHAPSNNGRNAYALLSSRYPMPVPAHVAQGLLRIGIMYLDGDDEEDEEL